jgi:biopolymer transport protein ExbB
MIRVFYEMHATGGGVVDISMLSGGIYEAMVTTVGGLIVGILCIVFHNFLVTRIDAIAFMVEAKITQVNVHLRRIQK